MAVSCTLHMSQSNQLARTAIESSGCALHCRTKCKLCHFPPTTAYAQHADSCWLLQGAPVQVFQVAERPADYQRVACEGELQHDSSILVGPRPRSVMGGTKSGSVPEDTCALSMLCTGKSNQRVACGTDEVFLCFEIFMNTSQCDTWGSGGQQLQQPVMRCYEPDLAQGSK